MRYLLPFLFLLPACSASAHQTNMTVADAVSQSVNAVAPTVVEEYRVELRTCRVEAAGDYTKYALCASEVDERWSHFRDAYRGIRNLQNTYAKALEAKDPGLTDYVQWLQTSWCQLKAVSPAGLKLPAVPGLVCKDE